MNCRNIQQLNITCGTDVVLHDTLIFDDETFDPSLSTDIEANLVNSLGKRTALDYTVADERIIIQVPWVEGRNAGCYGLEVKGVCNERKWSTYADALIRYTRATVEGAAEVEVASDYYDITQIVGYRYTDSPIRNVTVEVDDNYGEPEATTTYDGRDLDIELKNIRGNGIVSVEQTVTSTEDGGINETTMTQDNGNTTVIQVRNGSKGDKGDKGDTGDSAIFNPETGNISEMKQTTGDDVLSPMSQKAVTDELDGIKQKVIDVVDISGWTYDDSFINPSNQWRESSASYGGKVLSNVDSKALRGKYIKVFPQEGKSAYIAFTKNYSTVDETAVVYAGGYTAKIGGEVNTPLVVKVPNDTEYIYFHGKQGIYNLCPTGLSILEYATMQDLYNDIDALKQSALTVGNIEKSMEMVDLVDYTLYTKGKLLKSDGTIVDYQSSQVSVIKTYTVDDTKTYYVNCRVPKSTDYAAVCFYGTSDTFISAVFAGDGTTDAYNLTNAEVTPPSGAVKMVVWGRTDYIEPMLYISNGMIDVNDVRLDVEELKDHPLKGKKIAVIGDSISTIYNGNNPYFKIQAGDVGQTIQSYVSWFDVYTNDAGTTATNKTIGGVTLTESMIDGELHSFTPISADVGKELYVPRHYSGNTSSVKVWSQVLCETTGATLLANASYSGGCMNSSEEITRGTLFKASHAWHPCTIGRCKVRDENGEDVTPDVIIIARGTNDLSFTDNGNYAHLLLDFPNLLDGFRATTDFVSEGTYNFVVAYILTIQGLREAYPDATIVCTTPNFFKNVHYDVWPTRNDAHTYPELCDTIRKIANCMGCGLIELDKDGITWQNAYPDYISDSEVHPIHPNANGHRVMGEKAVKDIEYILDK